MTWAQRAGAETSLSPGSLFQSSRQVRGPIRDGPSKGLLFQISGPSRPGCLVAPIALIAVGSEAFRASNNSAEQTEATHEISAPIMVGSEPPLRMAPRFPQTVETNRGSRSESLIHRANDRR